MPTPLAGQKLQNYKGDYDEDSDDDDVDDDNHDDNNNNDGEEEFGGISKVSGENLRQKVVGKENKVVSKKLDQAYIQLAPKRLSLIVEFQIKKMMLIIIFMMMIQFLSKLRFLIQFRTLPYFPLSSSVRPSVTGVTSQLSSII